MTKTLALCVTLATLACGDDDGGGGGTPPVVDVHPPGTPMGAPAMGNLGPEGGTLASADGRLILTVPPGAVTGPTDFVIQPVTNSAPGGRGVAYLITPEGPFGQPVQLDFQADEADLAGTAAEALGIGYHGADGRWRALENATVSGTSVSGTTDHLSEWSMVSGFQLDPGTAMVQLNRMVDLTVVFCASVPDPDPQPGMDELPSLLARCQPDDGLAAAREWSVNAIPGGDSSVGTVSGGSESATYTAPGTAPSPNIVAVSARVGLPGRGEVTLVSNIRVSGGAYSGTVSADHSFSNMGIQVHETMTAAVAFDPDPMFPGVLMLTSGTYHATYLLMSPNYGGCTTQGERSGTLASMTSTLSLSTLPGQPTTYYLLISPTDAIDGTSDCNDNHIVVTAEGIAVVLGAATTGYRPVGENGEINDTFTSPGAGGGTVTVTVSLTSN